MLIQDWRRSDLRDSAFYTPYWISSGLMTGPEMAVTSASLTASDIAGVSGAPDSITGTAAAFVTSGFLDSDIIFVSGFTGAGAVTNLDFFTLAAAGVPGVAAATLTILAAETTLLSDAAGEAVTIVAPRANVVFSFPTAGEIIVIHEIVVQVLTGFTASTKLIVGGATIPLETSTTGGVATITDKDSYFASGQITTPQTIGYYGPTTGVGSTWLTAAAARSYVAPRVLVGVAAAVPTISVWVANAAAITAGVMRLHALITRIPGK